MKPLAKLLQNELTEEELELVPRSYDVVGSEEKSVAIIEIPEELENKKKLIGEAVMKLSTNIKSVLTKVSSRKGTYRLDDLELVAGDSNTEVLHKEHGYVLKLDPRNLKPMTDTGKFDEPAEVIANVPVTSDGIPDVLEKSSVTNFEVCWRDGTLTVVVPSCRPSLFRSVRVTFTFDEFGFTIATPVLMVLPTSANIRPDWISGDAFTDISDTTTPRC